MATHKEWNKSESLVMIELRLLGDSMMWSTMKNVGSYIQQYLERTDPPSLQEIIFKNISESPTMMM